MNTEREDQNFEREENERLRAAFDSYNSSNSSQTSFEEDEWEYIVDRYIDLNDEPKAKRAAEEGFSAHPYSSSLLVKYCDSLVIAKEFQKTIEILDNYRDSFPPNSDILLSYCRVYIGMKDIVKARGYFNQSMEIESFPEDICDSVHTLAQDCMEIGEFEEALYYLDRTEQLTKLWNDKNHSKEKAENIASLYFDYAFCNEKLDKNEEALNYYEKYLDLDPFSDIVWYNVGAIYTKKQLYGKAHEALDYAIALNSKNPSALFNMGHVCLELGLFTAAVEYLEEYNKIEKNSPDGIASLAMGYLYLGDLTQAEILLRKALIFDPNHQMALIGLAEVQTEKKLRKKMRKR